MEANLLNWEIVSLVLFSLQVVYRKVVYWDPLCFYYSLMTFVTFLMVYMSSVNYMLMILNCIHATMSIVLKVICWLPLVDCITGVVFGSCKLPLRNVLFALCLIFMSTGRSSSSYGTNNQAFAIVDNVRDLDVTIDSQLKFDKHIAGIVHKAMNRANLILKNLSLT